MPGTNISDIIVGAGGTGASGTNSGGNGGVGRVSVTCSSTPAVPSPNDRGIVFYNSGAFGSSTSFVYSSGGNVGLGTTSPQATLDVNGYIKLKINSSAPVTCSSTYDGALALTHVYTLCACNGTTATWVKESDGATACAW